MRFVQFYFGLPLAMIVLSVAFVPRFYRMRVYTTLRVPPERASSRRRASSLTCSFCCSA